MSYKTKLQHAYDRLDQSSELMYTQKFQKAGMSIFDDAKSYKIKILVIIYIHMNILKMNFLIFLH